MIAKTITILYIVLFVNVLLPANVALADTGPKPSMEFEFKQEFTGETVTIVDGILFECDQSDCSDAVPLEEVGPQGLYCDPEGCRAIAYGFAPYHRLEVEFSDGETRQSNIFETAGFNSKYSVIVQSQDLLVESQPGLNVIPRNMLLVLLCAGFLAGGVALIVLILFLIRRFSRG